MTSAPHRESGFAIVEAVAAAGLLATALVALAHVLAVATTASAGARDVTLATFSASQKIEQLRADPYPEIAVVGEDRVDDRFVRHWRVRPVTGIAAVAMVVEVTPLGRPGGRVRLETIRARP